MIGTIAYDNLGRRTSLTLGNGLATTYAYDTVSRLGELKLELPGTTDDLTSTFTYNPASQIAKNVRSNDAYSWTGHGSGTTSTTANGLNQIAGWVTTIGHDAKGNITSDGTYTYGYSSENLLTSLANSAPGALQPSIAFAYDPLMRLSVIDSTNSGFDVEFGYDGQEMVVEALSGGRTRRYVHGPGIDEPLVGYLVTPGVGTTRLWYQGDERGSITRLSNDAGVGGIGKYDEYGVGGSGRFRYTGQYWLGEANLLYYRARIYDARLGRFLQPDPIGYGDGMHIYAYVSGDPINLTDPMGDRGLTPGERALLEKRFGGLVDPVPLFHINLPYSTTYPWEINISRSSWTDDFSKGTPQQRELFWHEFYHLFEHQNGIKSWWGMAADKILHGQNESTYNYDPKKSFADQHYEARAEYFGRCASGQGPCDALKGVTFETSATTSIKFENGVFVVTQKVTGTRIPRVTTVSTSGSSNGSAGESKSKGVAKNSKKK